MPASFEVDYGVTRRFTKKEFERDLAQFAAELRGVIEAEVDGFDADPAASAKRRQRVIDGDFEFFARTYFPHYVKGEPSVMHEHIFRRLPEIFAEPESVTETLIAPRGEAKSTIVTQIGAMFGLVTGQKHFVVIIMAALEAAVLMMAAIKGELESNPRLATDFPEACGQGRVWQAAEILTANGAKVKAAGWSKALRGMRHGPYRPDLVLLDDLETDEMVKNRDQRKKLDDFIDKAIIPLGPTGGKMDLLYVGTVLHYDAVIVRKSKTPLWTGAKFKSIIQFPDRMDLWDRWEEIIRNNPGPNGVAEANAFYARQKDVMDAGAVVSWPTMRPLELLMKLRLKIGVHNFNCEQQNTPSDQENATFGKITFWVNTLSSWLMYGACDPSMGKKTQKSDPSAILVGGYNRETGVLDIVEASICKRLPTIIMNDIIKFQADYKCRAWGVETVQFQEFFATQLVAESARRQMPVPMVPIKSTTEKELRIEALEPHVTNGLIRVHPRLVTLIEQLEHWGEEGTHDDGPDALEMLWTLVLRRMGQSAGALRSLGERRPGALMKGYGVNRYGSGGFRGGFGGMNG